MTTTLGKTAIGGALIGLAVLAVTTGALVAQEPTAPAGGTPTPDHAGMMGGMAAMPGGTPTAGEMHETMHRMMDAMHGAGTSDRMHEAMGPDGERLMEQCVAMMQMMGMMSGMMSGQGMEGMMGMPSPTPTPAI